MAEFFGILAAITGLISTGTKLSTQLSEFIDGFRSAPRDSQNLARELHELCSTLDRLWRSLSGGVPRENGLFSELRDVLGSCGDKFEEMEIFVKTYMVREDDGLMARKIKKWKWGFREKDVVALRNQLEAHKATLGVTLLLATHTGTSEAAGRIEQHIQEVKNKLVGDGDSKAAKALSPVLRKYLDACSALSILSSPPAPPYVGRNGSQLPRVAEHNGQRLRGHTQSVPPPDTALGEEISRSASAASMRPLRYKSTVSMQRRHSGIPQPARPESTRRDSDPQPMLRERYRRGKTPGQLEMQKKVAAAKELDSATEKIWGDVRFLIEQNLPYEVLSEKLLQAQLRLEQIRENISRQYGQGNPQHAGKPTVPAAIKAAERGAIRQPQIEKSLVVVRESEAKGKTKDEKPKTKSKGKSKEAETKKKAKDEKSKKKLKVQKAAPSDTETEDNIKEENVRIQAAAQETALEQLSPSERAMEAARLRELILPKVRTDRVERGSLLVRNPTIGRIAEESDQSAQERPRLEKPWPVSSGSIPFSTRVYKTNVCKEVLDEDEIEYTEEDDSFIIHRNVSMLDQMSLRIRTNQIRGI